MYMSALVKKKKVLDTIITAYLTLPVSPERLFEGLSDGDYLPMQCTVGIISPQTTNSKPCQGWESMLHKM